PGTICLFSSLSVVSAGNRMFSRSQSRVSIACCGSMLCGSPEGPAVTNRLMLSWADTLPKASASSKTIRSKSTFEFNRRFTIPFLQKLFSRKTETCKIRRAHGCANTSDEIFSDYNRPDVQAVCEAFQKVGRKWLRLTAF